MLLKKLIEKANPFIHLPWSNIRPICLEDINQFIKDNNIIAPEIAARNRCNTREEHIARVAYLVLHKDPKPITMHHARWPIKDGNHRLMAAIFRDDYSIEVNYLRER